MVVRLNIEEIMRYNINKIIIFGILVLLILNCSKKNQSPYTPYTPIGPSSGLVGNYYTFSSLAVDPNDDSVAIRFVWSNDDTSDWCPLVGSGEVVAMMFSWLKSGVYILKAQAMDVNGFTSEWSLPQSIVIIYNLPPKTPSIPKGCSLGYILTDYSFSSCSIDPDGDSVAIRFSWGDGDTSDWSLQVRNGDSVKMSHFWLKPDTFYIKAQAKDIYNVISEWSLPHIILIVPDTGQPGPNRPPYPPSTPSGPSSGYCNTVYQFSSCAIDPDSNIVKIKFDWGDGDSSWSSFVRSGDTVKMSHSWLEPDTYYIKALARDDFMEFSDWSERHLIEIISYEK